jgi:SAM-dependent methyltransferase
MMGGQPYFTETAGCPFCRQRSSAILDSTQYHETAEANRRLPNITGRLLACAGCGVAYPSHLYTLEAFPVLYEKSLSDLTYFDKTVLQVLRKRYLRLLLRNHHRRLSLSRFLDFCSLNVFQVPLVTRKPLGLRMLDVGCGFGEFLAIYKKFGNDITGTEVIPGLVHAGREQGFDIRSGELETIDFGGQKFDVVILRAVFYRTRQPAGTLEILKNLLAEKGEIALVDPCPGKEGASYFFRKQFPQGQFYITDRDCFLSMLDRRFGMTCYTSKLIYGRPSALLKPVRLLGNVIGLSELLTANLFHYKPYMLSYTLQLSK